jgi:molybdopterin/thiamine biosynthesis adenylyltransferase/ubiquitin-protein ligase
LGEKESFLFHLYEDSLSRIEYHLLKLGNYSRLDKTIYNNGLDSWETDYKNSKGLWKIHIIFPRFYPYELPKIKIINANNLFLENPHIDEDGFLCIIPNSESYDTEDIFSVFDYLIQSAREILNGTMKSDFQDEFDAYWNRNTSPYQKRCILVSSPEQLEGKCFVFIGEEIICISKNDEKLASWLDNFCSEKIENLNKRDCFILNLEKPLLPDEYPNSIYDVLELTKNKNMEIYTDLVEFILNSHIYCFVLLIQKNLTKYSLGGILLLSPHLNNKQELSKGFRRGYVPLEIIMKRAISLLKNTLIDRYKITRVDHNWIHSRGGDGTIFDKKSIVLLGCGSLGGYIAHYLAKAGIGNIFLIDKDKLEFSNIGRHILGGDSVDKYKSVALEQKLKSEMPHLTIKGIGKDWREAYEENNKMFQNVDLIISTMADWPSEKSLNLLAKIKNFPPIIYIWLEPFAVAGHCFVSIPGSGCIECQMDNKGNFSKTVACFESAFLKREVGSCTYYQEYGPSALIPIVSMAVSEILRNLSLYSETSKLATWISDKDHLNNVNAKLTEEWEKSVNTYGYSKVYYNNLFSAGDCKICSRI